MKLKRISLAARCLLGLIPAVCSAQNFSADVVYLAAGRPDAPSSEAQALDLEALR